MANIQKQFEQFHNAIRIDFDSSEILREKRDIIVGKITDFLRAKGYPCFDVLLQGSYKTRTGVKPLEPFAHDIDIGLRFKLESADYTASAVRSWVLSALDGHTDKVESMECCIRVGYQKGYHVDLVCYAAGESGNVTQTPLATKSRNWVPADPQGLLDYINAARARFDGTEDSTSSTDQFRRVVRYLRRWDDFQVQDLHCKKPSGLAFIIACTNHLNPSADDRVAVSNVARALAETPGRIVLRKPTPEYEDLLAKFDDAEMSSLKQRFAALVAALNAAGDDIDPVVACTRLQKCVGEDFPVPAKADTARRTSAPAIITSSTSA